MKKMIFYLAMLCKRQLKRPSFLIILLIFPLFTVLFSINNREKTSSIQVALFCQDPSEFTSLIMTKLVDREGLIDFYICESKDKLLDDVSKKSAECGYIIYPDLLEKLNRGKRKNQIDLIVSPSSTMSKITNEVVYSELFEEYSLELLKDFIKNDDLLVDYDLDYLNKTIETLYRLHMADGSTFSFEYENGLETYETTLSPILLAPVKGLIAILILLSGFSGALNYYNDKESHIFDNMPFFLANSLRVLSIAAPVILSTIMGLLCILFSGGEDFLSQSFFTLILYAFSVIGFSCILMSLLKNKIIFASLIPIILIGSLIFTPVFIDFSTFVPMLKPLRYLFLPYYYLNTLAHFKSGIVIYTALCLGLFTFSISIGQLINGKQK